MVKICQSLRFKRSKFVTILVFNVKIDQNFGYKVKMCQNVVYKPQKWSKFVRVCVFQVKILFTEPKMVKIWFAKERISHYFGFSGQNLSKLKFFKFIKVEIVIILVFQVNIC